MECNYPRRPAARQSAVTTSLFCAPPGGWLLSLGLVLTTLQAAAEGSAQSGLNQRLLDLQQNIDFGYASVFDLDAGSLFVDVLSAGEVINVSLCGSNNSDALEVKIYNPADTLVQTETLPQANVDCDDTFTAPLTNPFRYITETEGRYRLVLENLSGRDHGGWTDSYFKRYDISVTADTDTFPEPTRQRGRLWAYALGFLANSASKEDSTDANYYVLANGGHSDTDYIWQLDLNNFAGYRYQLLANSIGVDAPNSGYSTSIAGNSVSYQYPLYMGVPAIARAKPTEPPQLADLRFVAAPAGVSDGHRFEFVSDVSGTYMLAIDRDQNGEFFDVADYRALGRARAGQNTVVWNGQDRQGDPLSAGLYQARLQLRLGEFHFIANDVETSGGDESGLTIYAADQGGSLSDTRVYWDDVGGLQSALDRSANLPQGLQSSVGHHTWGNFTLSSLGDSHYLDTYVYGLSASVDTLINLLASDANTTLPASVEHANALTTTAGAQEALAAVTPAQHSAAEPPAGLLPALEHNADHQLEGPPSSASVAAAERATEQVLDAAPEPAAASSGGCTIGDSRRIEPLPVSMLVIAFGWLIVRRHRGWPRTRLSG